MEETRELNWPGNRTAVKSISFGCHWDYGNQKLETILEATIGNSCFKSKHQCEHDMSSHDFRAVTLRPSWRPKTHTQSPSLLGQNRLCAINTRKATRGQELSRYILKHSYLEY